MARNCCKYFTVSLVPVASVVLAVLFGLAIAVLPVLYVQLAKQYRYGVIVDAGSSHTDMFFYRWEVPRYRDTAKHFQQEHHCYSDKSINSYADKNTSEAGSVLESCITKSKNRGFVTSGQRSNTQLFLGATAGMRLVYCKNVTLGEEIMSSVNSTLAGSGYHLVSGRVISGQEEAVAGWITGNYLQQHLKHSGSSSLMGSLDLGGASAEIAFLDSTSDPRSHTPYHTNVSLYDRSYTLYARSYLCYGLNEAYRRFLAHLINVSSSHQRKFNDRVGTLDKTGITWTNLLVRKEFQFSMLCSQELS
ncbi:Ectonucleoside triphosphate diphosphohydrolase 8 [Geodia barretti]|uniref:Ectonucleoside triphosphate diphosphohydrolase 8 n=1 Tax=Geodia barretti TaxID=519541 RepID=A0AA35T588_GEOBA|nr:Ectonucleoside triphosphate diphosphohydrolase 8 [Geodia barretti]